MKKSPNFKKMALTLVILVGVVVLGRALWDQVVASDFMISRSIQQRSIKREKMASDLMATDTIKVVLVGTAGPMSPDLAQNATAVFAGGQFLLFDAGDYAQKRMEQLHFPCESLDAVFITHFHNDHIADLGEVMQRSYILGREKDLTVYGPTGIEEIVAGFNMVYGADSAHRTDHHGEVVMPSAYHFATASAFDSSLEESRVYEKDGLVVTAFKTSHPPIEPTFGYVVTYQGKKIVISGDTLVTDSLARQANQADLLVMDIMNYELVTLMEDTFRQVGDEDLAAIMYDIREYHPDVLDVGQMARDQAVKRLALTHFAPAAPVKSMMKRFYVNPIKENYKGDLIAGGDGTIIRIPLD